MYRENIQSRFQPRVSRTNATLQWSYKLFHNFLPSPPPFLLAFSQNCEKRLITSPCLSVCPSAWNNSAPAQPNFVRFNIRLFFENLSRKFKFYWDLTRIHKDTYLFLVSYFFSFRILDQSCRENQTTHFMFNNFFIFIFPKIVPFMG